MRHDGHVREAAEQVVKRMQGLRRGLLDLEVAGHAMPSVPAL